jgi:thiol-disulfide isomerase/thioredoxin
MRLALLVPLALLLCLMPLTADADTDASPILQKCADSVRTSQHFSVTINLNNDMDKDTESAYLAFSLPNRLKIISRLQGTMTATVVCDGDTLWQWNKQYYRKRDAPATLDKITTSVPLGNAAVLARSLFLTQQELGVNQAESWQDTGVTKVDGITTHKLVSSGETAWLAASTGLPLKMTVHNDTLDYSATFTYPTLIKPLPQDTFVASRPSSIALMPMPYLHPPDSYEAGLLPDGAYVPDFSLPGLDGKMVSLSSLRGQVVVLDFWASWCPPCRETMPHIEELHQELDGHGVTFLSVNSWDTQDAMQEFLQENPQYDMKILFDNHSDRAASVASRKFQVTGIPTIYLIDQDGRVATAYVGSYSDEYTMLKDSIDQLLAR